MTTTQPSASTATPAGWHEDPLGRYQLRWWDGEHWTDQVQTSGLPGVDPLGTRPSDDPDHIVLLPSTPTSETDVDYRPRAGSRAITAGLLMIIGGIIGYLITSGIQGGAATAQALALWGTLGGIFGIITIAGVITLGVGAIRRMSSR